MKKLLVPIDGSKESEAAIPWADFLTQGKELSLELLRCFRPLSAMYSYPDFATPPPVSYDLSGFIRLSEKYLKSLQKEYNLADATAVVKEGNPAETILEQSCSEHINSIVISSHGSGGIGKWLLGSVTTKVLRGASKPVFVIKASEDERPEPKLKSILVCLDGSRLAEKALDPASSLAEQFDAELVLLRILNYTPYPVADLERILEEQQSSHRDYLNKLVERYSHLKCRAVTRTSDPVEGILKEGKGSDLIVLTSHGHTGFERWLLGSVTEKVLHRAQTPLLVVPGRES